MDLDVILPILKGQYTKVNDDVIKVRGKDLPINQVLEEIFRVSSKLEEIGDELATMYGYKISFTY